MIVSDIVAVAIGLSRTPATTSTFNNVVLLVDHADVPVDRVYAATTKSTYVAQFTVSTDHVSFLSTMWGQNYNPSPAYIGRWISAATSPYFVCGTHGVVSVFILVADGSMTVTTTAGADILTALDFTLDTSIAEVLVTIQTALDLGGVSGATVGLDSLGRIVFTDPAVTGDGSDTVVISASGSGTHLELPAYLNIAGGFAQGGMDIEAQGTALSRVMARTNAPFVICERGGSIAQVLALSVAVNAMDKILILNGNDLNAKDDTLTTDFGYQIEALGHNQTFLPYTEHTTQNPDAAICGEILPQLEGSVSFAMTPLSGLSRSGLDVDGTTEIPITTTEGLALIAKGYDYIVKPMGLAHFTHGKSAGGVEMRTMISKLFMATKFAESVYVYMLAQSVVTFSDEDLQAIKGQLVYWADQMVDRKSLGAGYTINMPSASDFTNAMKSTHQADLYNLLVADAQSSINKFTITMNWAVAG